MITGKIIDLVVMASWQKTKSGTLSRMRTSIVRMRASGRMRGEGGFMACHWGSALS